MTVKSIFQSAVPPTPGEAAAAAATWERRGILDRLVRLDGEAAPAADRRRAQPTARSSATPAARSL